MTFKFSMNQWPKLWPCLFGLLYELFPKINIRYLGTLVQLIHRYHMGISPKLLSVTQVPLVQPGLTLVSSCPHQLADQKYEGQ